ncbi:MULTISPECIES: MFS transporter [Actinomycetes]|jgi:MFS family permease|uniref:MFS transporter n=1 Tax=Actinomycetes TaxID=1760 RepID=UPI0011511BA8|nr:MULTISPECIES: MFS transporter [Actinomycetes]MCF6388773.1 MFS transporter [Mycobacterium sp. MBM]TQK27614.1 putative MFS family arabinose efflux permease [Arthrobacter sp. SLBN-53]TRW79490.1 MFS transporter [Mycolicibacterium sp. 018/SC-01/001]WAY17033.1 MFS transporter [Mycolicibacterium fortuitum]
MTQANPHPAPGAAHGLRWVLVTLCVTEISSWGVLYYAFTVLSEQISADTGWSPPAVTAAFSAGLVTAALVGIPIGRWLDRVGPRWIMTAGSILGSLAVVAVVTAPNYGWFVAAWVLAGVAMSAVFYAPAFAALTRFFGTDAVRALTALTLVAGFASTVFAPLTAALSAQMSWRHTYLVLAAVMAVITIPAHFFGLRRPWPAVTTTHQHVEAPTRTARSGPFLALIAAFALAGLASYAVIANLVPLMSQRGISTGAAAVALGLGGAGQVLGRLGYQRLVRRVGVVPRTVLVMAGVAATTALLGLFSSFAALVVVAIGAGVIRGIMTLLQATAVTERWGPTHYGHLSGILSAPIMIATAVGPFVGAALASLLGSYAAMFVALGAIAAAGALIAVATRPRVQTPAPVVRI